MPCTDPHQNHYSLFVLFPLALCGMLSLQIVKDINIEGDSPNTEWMKMSQRPAGTPSGEFPTPTATDVSQLVTAKSLWTFEKETKAVERNETAI